MIVADTVWGHGSHRYHLDTSWCGADVATHPVENCHEMVQVPDGRLFLLTDHPRNNILIFDIDGSLLGSWTFGSETAHGLSRDPSDPEALWITDNSGKVFKTDLNGRELLVLPTAHECGAYSSMAQTYVPTETAVAPNGDVYVADGYGSQSVLRFDRTGRYIGKFGQRSVLPSNPGTFAQVHGIAIDDRGAGAPLLVCTERLKSMFYWFTLEGEFLHSVYLPGVFMSRPVIDGDFLYAGVCFGFRKNDFRMWKDQGFVVILDADHQVVSVPGGWPPQKGPEAEWRPFGKEAESPLRNVHDVCVDQVGNLYICQWQADRVYPYKMLRLA